MSSFAFIEKIKLAVWSGGDGGAAVGAAAALPQARHHQRVHNTEHRENKQLSHKINSRQTV